MFNTGRANDNWLVNSSLAVQSYQSYTIPKVHILSIKSVSKLGFVQVYFLDENWNLDKATLFENHRKSLIQHGERSELHIHFEWTKVDGKIGGKCQIENIQMRHYEWFSNNVDYLSCGDKLWNQVGFGWTKNFSIESIVLEAAMEHFLWKGRSQVKIIRSFIYYSCREKRH